MTTLSSFSLPYAPAKRSPLFLEQLLASSGREIRGIKGGYIIENADVFDAAVKRLAQNGAEEQNTKGAGGGATDVRIAQHNNPYDNLLLIQSAPKNKFSDRESLIAFRIGIFPPKEKGGNSSPDKPSGDKPSVPPTKS